MRFTTVGRTGVTVSSLCFGTMSFHSYSDHRTSQDMFRACLDLGINFFDAANSYGAGNAEGILGQCIADAGCRDEIVLISKVCRPMGNDANRQGLSRYHIMREVENSLRRLRTDRIDFYFAHHFDPLTPAEETLRAFEDLRRQGKILYPAVSNWAAWRIAKALGISARESLARFELVQPIYNLVKRQAEMELFPMAIEEQMGVIVYSPLASGLLTGRYSADRAPDAGRLAQPRYQQRYGDRSNFEVASRFADFARERGCSPVALAIAWAMSHQAVTAPIIGAETVEQLHGYVDALAIDMTPELRAEITALAPPMDESLERVAD